MTVVLTPTGRVGTGSVGTYDRAVGSHDHAHAHSHSHGSSTRRDALVFSIVLIGGFMVAEIVGGLVFGSLALLADAAHMGTDVAALLIALGAQALATRPARGRSTYGLARAEVLGALVNAVLLFVASAWILYEAYERFQTVGDVDGPPVLVIATIGLAVNVVSAMRVAKVAGTNVNMRAAFWHMVGDALGSVGAITAALAVIFFDAQWVDPAASVFITVLVLFATVRVLRDTFGILLERAPAAIDVEQVAATLAEQPDVRDVHHLHVWSIGAESVALSAHVVLAGPLDLHEAQRHSEAMKAVLRDRFGIDHATLEVECHQCEAPGHATDSPASHPR